MRECDVEDSDNDNIPSGRSWLVFDGIKMGATIHIDGRLIGNATDQFRRLHFDVAPGHHTLEVVFDPRIEVDGRFMALLLCLGMLLTPGIRPLCPVSH